MRRSVLVEETEDHNRWLVSYSDLVTLLFAFFVVMYAVSTVNAGKYRVLSDSLVAAFRSPQSSLMPIQVGNPVRSPYRDEMSVRKVPTVVVPSEIPLPVHPTERPFQRVSFPLRRRPLQESGEPADIAANPSPAAAIVAPQTPDRSGETTVAPIGAYAGLDESLLEAPTAYWDPQPEPPKQAPDTISDPMADLARQIREALPSLIATDDVAVRSSKLSVELEIRNGVLFASGSAKLAPESMELLRRTAKVLTDIPNRLRVEGFTDDQPINTDVYPSNWELSAARAASVVHLFTKTGVNPSRMAAIGFGEHRPVVSNNTAAGRERNRRVLVVILADSDASDLFPTHSQGEDGNR
jgi:chemotaxis protein MotB